MPHFQEKLLFEENAGEELRTYYENILSYIRSRLNIIGTSVYLMETSLSQDVEGSVKYLQKINDEIEMIRKIINE